MMQGGRVRAWGWAVVLTAACALPALAEAPERSPRPIANPKLLLVAASADPGTQGLALMSVAPPAATAPASVVTDATGALMLMRPRPRPQAVIEAAFAATQAPRGAAEAVAGSAPAAMAPETAVAERKGLFSFLRPSKRPDDLMVKQAAAVRIKPGKEAVISKKGSVCGIPDIKGEKLAPITAKVKGCGIKDPVRVTSVAGIRLSTPATINCETAKSLRSWLTKAVEPVYGKGKVVEVKIAASYACRPRNNQRGAKVSEHGRGNAVDIAGFTFSNGKSVTVLGNYDKTMRKAHKAACGIFGTTLGPGSDGFHQDHLHFDVARYRGGPYCR